MTAAAHTLWIRQLMGVVRRVGPYAAIEVVLPGGSLVVLLLWFLRSRKDVRALTRMVRTCLVSAIEAFASLARA